MPKTRLEKLPFLSNINDIKTNHIYHTAESMIEFFLFIAILPSKMEGSHYIIND